MNNELELEGLSFPSEKWRPIEGYEGLYSISNLGRVFSHKSNRYLRPIKRTDDYLGVNLYKDGKVKKALVHRLVLGAFKPTSDSSLQVNHLDGNKENNRLSNLYWVTGSQNQRHAIYVLGSDHGYPRRAVIQFSRDGIRLGVFRSTMEAERATGVNQGDISKCARGRLRHAGGYVWQYLSDLPEEKKSFNNDLRTIARKQRYVPSRKAVAQFSKDGIQLNVFSSTRDAERATGVPHGSICKCAKGSQKQAGGYVWKYLSDLPKEKAAA